MTCQSCETKSHIYDLTQACCRARLLASLGSKQHRKSLLKYWRERMSDGEIARTIEALKLLSPTSAMQ